MLPSLPLDRLPFSPRPFLRRGRTRNPSSRRRWLRAAGVPLLTAGVSLGLVVTGPSAGAAPGSAPAQPKVQPSRTPAVPVLTAAARRARLEPGNATMGWYDRQAAVAAGPTTGAAKRKVPDRGPARALAAARVYGIDVASYQGHVQWTRHHAQSKRFAYVKATEGLSYRNPYFGSQYGGSAQAGFLRGAYHFAIPSRSSGVAQADYFVNRGGSWTKDGTTLPGVLDVEYNPYGSTCYGLSRPAMVAWISSFTTRYKLRTGRDAVIYSTADWWRTCTGNSTKFNRTNPLWIARYASTPGTLPGGWRYYTFWQYSGTTIDQDRFNGSLTRLRKLATG